MLNNSTAEKILTAEEEKEVRRKAESVAAAKAAAAENAYVEFERYHTGVRGLYSSGVSIGDAENLLHSCEGNKKILVKWCEENTDEGVTVANLERAFQALKPPPGYVGALAPIESDPTENDGARRVSQNGNARNLFPDQIQKPRAVTQPAVLPFTKRDLIEMSKNDYPRFKALIARHGSAALNAILQREE